MEVRLHEVEPPNQSGTLLSGLKDVFRTSGQQACWPVYIESWGTARFRASASIVPHSICTLGMEATSLVRDFSSTRTMSRCGVQTDTSVCSVVISNKPWMFFMALQNSARLEISAQKSCYVQLANKAGRKLASVANFHLKIGSAAVPSKEE